MFDIVILGAGGMGRETYEVIQDTFKDNSEYRIKGFLSDVLDILDDFEGYPPLLGTIKDYEVQPNDRFILAIGDVAGRRRIAESILERGGEFMTLISNLAKVDCTAQIGRGVIVFPFSHIGANTKIGDFCLMNLHAIVGHDSILGNFTEVCSFSVLGGATQTGEECFFAMQTATGPKVKLGNRVILSLGSVITEDVEDNSFVVGVPGRTYKRKSAQVSGGFGGFTIEVF